MALRPMKRLRSQRGAALVEAAMTVPILLLIAIGIFEFGRAYQFWQVLTNAAREAARYSVTPGSTVPQAQTIALTYMNAGGVTGCNPGCVVVDQAVAIPGVSGSATNVTIQYPFQFIVIQPVAALVTGNRFQDGLTMTATATMRNEGS